MRRPLHVVRSVPPVMVNRTDRFSSSWFPTSSNSWEEKKRKSLSPFKSRSSRGTDWEAADRAEGTGETSAAVLFIVKKTVWGGGGGGGVQNKTGLLMPALRHAQLPGAGMQNNAPHVH